MELLWLLLPVAAASGWWVARREYYGRRNRATARNTEYFKGLNYLIEDKPDQAIEVFTRMAGVDRNTAEIHLTLGNLFRRRGEVDRAIHIHGSLIARSTLTADQRRRAMLELGEDYLRAGLFDRAEELFRELLEQPDHTEIALSRLIHIFQQEKDWRQAITYCDRLEQIGGESKKRETAHFCCELAEESSQDDDTRTWLLDALARDPGCARANLLLGRLAMRAGDHRAAIAAFQAVERQDRGYFPELIAPLGQCYDALDRLDEWGAYLREVQQRDHGGRITDASGGLAPAARGRGSGAPVSRTRITGISDPAGLAATGRNSTGTRPGGGVRQLARLALRQHADAQQRRPLPLRQLRFCRQGLALVLSQLPAVEHDQTDARSGHEDQRLKRG